jgi:hypothetical protein
MFLDYVTSEIRGDAERKKKILKRGALSAIGIVMVLYMTFNFFLVSKHHHPHDQLLMIGAVFSSRF